MESSKKPMTEQQRINAIRLQRMYSSKYNPIWKLSDREFMQSLQKDGAEMLARKDVWID